MSSDTLEILIELSKRKGKVTTSALAKTLGSSQQTISRKIRELEGRGLVNRISHHRGQIITPSERGVAFMRRRYLDLREFVERSGEPAISFGGNLVSGSGEGRYYVGQEKYFLQFQEKLGFRPFLGTLNIKMKSVHDLRSKTDMEKTRPIMVGGFRKDKRTFGDIRCYPCIINRKVRGAVIVPERTHHPADIVEIIAPADLRRELSMKENDYVHVEMRA